MNKSKSYDVLLAKISNAIHDILICTEITKRIKRYGITRERIKPTICLNSKTYKICLPFSKKSMVASILPMPNLIRQ